MARHLEFKPNEALRQAMLTFWQRGYAGTSVDDLETSTGVGRKSLYRAFRDKHDLFLKSLVLYRQVIGNRNLGPLERPGADLTDIQDLLRGFVSHCGTEEGRTGCLIANTAQERAWMDPQAADQVRLYFERIRSAVRNALSGARRSGQIDPGRDIEALSSYFVGIVQGICVMGRADAPRAMVEDFVETALATLEHRSHSFDNNQC